MLLEIQWDSVTLQPSGTACFTVGLDPWHGPEGRTRRGVQLLTVRKGADGRATGMEMAGLR